MNPKGLVLTNPQSYLKLFTQPLLLSLSIAAAMETLRIRLVLDNSLKTTAGLKKCWILLKPQHQTISDLSSHILRVLDLHNACPQGLVLSMEGFVLPPFESTYILRDRDIIRVKMKGGTSTEIIKIDNGLHGSLDVVELVDKPPVSTGMNLLANEEFQNESGGYESEPEEDVPKEAEDVLHVENSPEVKTVSKKRKASKELHSPKKKKTKSASKEKCVEVTESMENNVCALQNGTLSIGKADERSSKCRKDVSSAKKSCQTEQNGNEDGDASHTLSGTKKFPSRSARRKKAKRQWLKEQLKAEKKVRQLLPKISQQASEKDSQAVSEASPEQGTRRLSEEKLREEDHLQEQDSDIEGDVVPVVIRPGHIRFEPLKRGSSDLAVPENHIPNETYQWNGITSKKKGQKWGKEKAVSCKRKDRDNFERESSSIFTIGEQKPVNDRINFEECPFYASLPKQGDLIAYRLVELSALWTPELSSYRVGKISNYDLESNAVILVQVPEYPVIPERIDDEASGSLSGTSPYGEDGSLEIKFSSLHEVRLVLLGYPNSSKSVAGGSHDVTGKDQDSGIGFRPENNNGADTSAQENGKRNVWEEISQALTAKKALLSQEDSWRKPESSWSYRALMPWGQRLLY